MGGGSSFWLMVKLDFKVYFDGMFVRFTMHFAKGKQKEYLFGFAVIYLRYLGRMLFDA